MLLHINSCFPLSVKGQDRIIFLAAPGWVSFAAPGPRFCCVHTSETDPKAEMLGDPQQGLLEYGQQQKRGGPVKQADVAGFFSAPSTSRCAGQMLFCATVTSWLSRQVLWWSRSDPCPGGICGQVLLAVLLPGDDLHTELAMPVGPSQVTVHPCPTCLQSCPVGSL